MYSKAIFVALFSLSLSVAALPSDKKVIKSTAVSAAETCAAEATTKTVTVTASAIATSITSAASTGTTSNATSKTTSKATTGAKPTPPATNPKGGNNAAASAGNAKTGANTGANTGATSDPNTSLCLIKQSIMTLVDGSDGATAGQELSETSTNNYINFCGTGQLPLTNGQQITSGSCNAVPMGQIPSTANMPSAKFVNPANGATIPANTDFTIQLRVDGFETGHFTNADSTYYSAPQELNAAGQIKGHSHVTVQKLDSLDQTTTLDPKDFQFFKGLNAAAQNGILSAVVTGGLPVGFYRVSSINSAANHQPVLVAVAQRGSTDDVAYFTVTDDNTANQASTGTAAATGKATTTGKTGATGKATTNGKTGKTDTQNNSANGAAAKNGRPRRGEFKSRQEISV